MKEQELERNVININNLVQMIKTINEQSDNTTYSISFNRTLFLVQEIENYDENHNSYLRIRVGEYRFEMTKNQLQSLASLKSQVITDKVHNYDLDEINKLLAFDDLYAELVKDYNMCLNMQIYNFDESVN